MMCRLEKRTAPEKLKTIELFPVKNFEPAIKGLIVNESQSGLCVLIHKEEIQKNNCWLICNHGRYEMRWQQGCESVFSKVGLLKVS